MEKFWVWDCSKFWQHSCHVVLCSLNSCYIRVVFDIVRNLLLYLVLGSQGAPVAFLFKFGFIDRNISSVTSSKWAGGISMKDISKEK